jgi:hypothetical protein
MPSTHRSGEAEIDRVPADGSAGARLLAVGLLAANPTSRRCLGC